MLLSVSHFVDGIIVLPWLKECLIPLVALIVCCWWKRCVRSAVIIITDVKKAAKEQAGG